MCSRSHPFPLRCPPNVYGGAGGSPDFEPDATGACPLVLDFTHADSLDGIIYAGNSYVTSFPHNDTRSELWALDLKHCIPTTADETTASGQFDGNSTCGLWTLVDTFGARGQSLDTRASGFFDYNLVIFGTAKIRHRALAVTHASVSHCSVSVLLSQAGTITLLLSRVTLWM